MCLYQIKVSVGKKKKLYKGNKKYDINTLSNYTKCGKSSRRLKKMGDKAIH